MSELFEKESLALLTDLNCMPRNNVTNKVGADPASDYNPSSIPPPAPDH
jgi:hypothetical protein